MQMSFEAGGAETSSEKLEACQGRQASGIREYGYEAFSSEI